MLSNDSAGMVESLSFTVTPTLAMGMPLYLVSELAALWVSEWVSVTVSVSLPAVTVTVWAVAQFVVVKVNGVGVAVMSAAPCPPMVIVTLAVGWLSRTTV